MRSIQLNFDSGLLQVILGWMGSMGKISVQWRNWLLWPVLYLNICLQYTNYLMPISLAVLGKILVPAHKSQTPEHRYEPYLKQPLKPASRSNYVWKDHRSQDFSSETKQSGLFCIKHQKLQQSNELYLLDLPMGTPICLIPGICLSLE